MNFNKNMYGNNTHYTSFFNICQNFYYSSYFGTVEYATNIDFKNKYEI